MAGRRQHLLTFSPLLPLLPLPLLLVVAGTTLRAESAAVAPSPTVSSSPQQGQNAGTGGGDRSLEGVPVAEREAFLRNLQRWRAMPQAEREAIRQQFRIKNDQRRVEAERALADTGLQLGPDQREVFLLRYQQERRKLERELREALRAERARRLPEVNARLKREFTPAASPSPSPSPSPVTGTAGEAATANKP